MCKQSVSHLGRLMVAAGLWVLLTGAARAKAQPKPAADNSLTTEQYVEAGLPSIDKPWSNGDYVKAGEVLKKIAADDVTQLPRYESAKSGKVFARMISQKNLDAFTDKATPVDDRMELVQHVDGYVAVFSLYATQLKPEQTLDIETLELGGFILRMELAATKVTPEFLDAHPERKSLQAVQDGLKQMRGGYAQSAGGVAELLVSHDSVRPAQAVRFIGELKGYLPSLVAEFEPDARQKIKAQIQTAAAAEQDKDLKQALGELLGAVK